MDKPLVGRDKIVTMLETKFINVYDLQYAPGKHYYDVTRRRLDNLMALASNEDFKQMIADAVTCFVILKVKDKEPRLLSFYEYRYPTGRFLLGPPAGLVDPEDRESENPLINTAKREIKEETGLTIKDSDRIFVVNPLAFSTPGMTDESNALVCAVIELESEDLLNTDGAVGSEVFDGFKLLTKAEARKILKDGKDPKGDFYSMYMWAAMMYFVSGMWEEEE